MWQWQPIGGVVWSIENETVKNILLVVYLAGWAIVFIATFLINHFDLFGLRQVWLYFRGRRYTFAISRTIIWFVRHPLYFGFPIAFWPAPVMTIAHLLFAILTTGYIFTKHTVGRKDLTDHFGEQYKDYKRTKPMIIPFTKDKY